MTKLSILRRAKKLTQKTLAEKLKTDQATISLLENRELAESYRPDLLEQIADILGFKGDPKTLLDEVVV